MSKRDRATDAAVAARVEQLRWELRTYGRIEAAAGVTDRVAFWKQHPTEESARAALWSMIEKRVRSELTQPTKEN